MKDLILGDYADGTALILLHRYCSWLCSISLISFESPVRDLYEKSFDTVLRDDNHMDTILSRRH